MFDFDEILRFKRINVIGTSGSGKSTLARELEGILDIPFHQMDQLHWQANWQPATNEQLFASVREITSRDNWILDGNYSSTTALKWQRVQLVIWLDLSFIRTVTRVLTRTVRRIRSGEEIWPGTGNRETWKDSFASWDSVIWWSITTHHKNRRQYEKLMKSPDYPHIKFIRLTSAKCVDSFVDGLRSAMQKRQSLV